MTQSERLKELLISADKYSETICTDYNEAQAVCADYLIGEGVLAPLVFVGQMVYYYCSELGGVFPYFVENLNIGYMDKERNYWTYEANCHDEETDELLDEIDFDYDDIGKTVFLTREEAEKALAERSANGKRTDN